MDLSPRMSRPLDRSPASSRRCRQSKPTELPRSNTAPATMEDETNIVNLTWPDSGPSSVSSRSYLSIPAHSWVGIVGRSNAFGSGMVVPRYYSVPTHCLKQVFKTMDQRDSPGRPGKIEFGALKRAIEDFYYVFNSGGACTSMQAKVVHAIGKLQEQAEAHMRRTPNIDQTLVYWEQGIVFDCFQVRLPFLERVFFTFDISDSSTWSSKFVSTMVLISIFLSIFTFVLSTVPYGTLSSITWMPYVDLACVCVFTIDYVARLLTVPFARMELLDKAFVSDVITGRRERQLFSKCRKLTKFLFSFMGMVDLAAVVPFWVDFALNGLQNPIADGNGSEVLRIFVVTRMVRIFKIGKLANADLGDDRNMTLTLFTKVVREAYPALQLVVMLIVMALLVLGTLIWFVENGTYFPRGSPNCPVGAESLCAEGAVRLRRFPDGTYEITPSPFDSIPFAFWWVLVTITTVGYGDIYPVTQLGYVVGSVTILYGAIVFALPVGVIGTTFSQQYEQLHSETSLLEAMVEEEEEAYSSGAVSGMVASMVSRTTYRTSRSSSTGEENVASLPIPLVLELRTSLQQLTMTLGISHLMFKKWSDELVSVTKFDYLPREHPCEALEHWARPVFLTLKEHVAQDKFGAKFYTQTSWVWYRLLAHIAVAFCESFDPWDRAGFDRRVRDMSNGVGSVGSSSRLSPSSYRKTMPPTASVTEGTAGEVLVNRSERRTRTAPSINRLAVNPVIGAGTDDGDLLETSRRRSRIASDTTVGRTLESILERSAERSVESFGDDHDVYHIADEHSVQLQSVPNERNGVMSRCYVIAV